MSSGYHDHEQWQVEDGHCKECGADLTGGPYVMPLAMHEALMERLMLTGYRDDLILANQINHLFGASARRAWDQGNPRKPI